jgi:hypothetical protein
MGLNIAIGLFYAISFLMYMQLGDNSDFILLCFSTLHLTSENSGALSVYLYCDHFGPLEICNRVLKVR